MFICTACCMLTVPVRVLKTRPLEDSVASGALVTLGCDLGGQPLPAVTWLFRGEPVRRQHHQQKHPQHKNWRNKKLKQNNDTFITHSCKSGSEAAKVSRS